MRIRRETWPYSVKVVRCAPRAEKRRKMAKDPRCGKWRDDRTGDKVITWLKYLPFVGVKKRALERKL